MKPKEKTPFEERENVASASECTGLMPSMCDEDDPASVENVARLYAIHAPKKSAHRE